MCQCAGPLSECFYLKIYLQPKWKNKTRRKVFCFLRDLHGAPMRHYFQSVKRRTCGWFLGRTMGPEIIISVLSWFSFRNLACIHNLISVRQLVRVELSCSGDGFNGYVIYWLDGGRGDHESRWNQQGGAGRRWTREDQILYPMVSLGSEGQ